MAILDNIVAYYKLDESSGNAIDSVASFDLTNNNTAAYASGKINNAVDFGSGNTNKSLTRADNLGITGDEALTISGWVKLNDEIAADEWEFFGHSDDSANPNYINLRYSYNGGTRRLGISTGFSLNSLYEITLGTANWYHLIITRDASNNTELFVNSVSQGTGSDAAQDVNANAFAIGQTAESSDKFSSVLVDEVGVWNRVLTQAEIEVLYNGGSGLQYPFSSFIPQIIMS